MGPRVNELRWAIAATAVIAVGYVAFVCILLTAGVILERRRRLTDVDAYQVGHE
jgi:hypothetical protein